MMGTMHSETKLLMDVIGFPDSLQFSSNHVNESVLLSLLPLAIENKIQMLFLEKAENLLKTSKSLESLRQSCFEKSQSVLALLGEMSKTLANNHLDSSNMRWISRNCFFCWNRTHQ